MVRPTAAILWQSFRGRKTCRHRDERPRRVAALELAAVLVRAKIPQTVHKKKDEETSGACGLHNGLGGSGRRFTCAFDRSCREGARPPWCHRLWCRHLLPHRRPRHRRHRRARLPLCSLRWRHRWTTASTDRALREGSPESCHRPLCARSPRSQCWIPCFYQTASPTSASP